MFLFCLVFVWISLNTWKLSLQSAGGNKGITREGHKFRHKKKFGSESKWTLYSECIIFTLYGKCKTLTLYGFIYKIRFCLEGEIQIVASMCSDEFLVSFVLHQLWWMIWDVGAEHIANIQPLTLKSF